VPTYTHAWLCQQIVDHAQDAMIFADGDGVIRLWNAGAEAIFGYRAEEAVGRTLDLIIPENLRARHWSGYRHVMATGVTRYGQEVLAVPALRKDGRRISLEFTVVLLRDAAGELLGPAAVIREVTARWQRDKALKDRLAMLEAREGGAHEAPGGR
jgi:PAS domain S-box-containing protein